MAGLIRKVGVTFMDNFTMDEDKPTYLELIHMNRERERVRMWTFSTR